jgi:hypothetical protein
MTSKETHALNLKMATEVMGWKRTGKIGYVDWLLDDKGNRKRSCEQGGIIYPGDWLPCTDIAQAMQCVEKMREKSKQHFRLEIIVSESKWIIQMINPPWMSIRRGASLVCDFADLPATICRVIADALERGKQT